MRKGKKHIKSKFQSEKGHFENAEDLANFKPDHGKYEGDLQLENT